MKKNEYKPGLLKLKYVDKSLFMLIIKEMN